MTIGAVDQSFRGFAGDPQSELEVAYLLGLAQEYLPFPLVVTAINDTFPDCEGLDPTTGRRVTIELEVRSRNFHGHRHPVGGCDYIVCWEDDWKDAPVDVRAKIICLKNLFHRETKLARKFLDIPRPESLRAQLAEIRDANPDAHVAVTHLLEVGLRQMQLRIPGVTLDDTRTKHFSVRYGSGKGVLGVFPAGKLVAGSVDHMVERYGKVVAAPTRKLRDVVERVGVLTTQKQCPAILDALEQVMRAIASTQAGLSVRPRGTRTPTQVA